ncbi:transcription elongation factor GreA [bacterium]|jgi:transcription elongation factor GreA|nr:transcription elongation factor GreA [bacterium]MBT6831582.1 transcription elongation factor GreA [bacterium]MBT6995961.1 transcription elongation factor GreA [bacterium]MBT7772264.1 transcription elongation factor GreA [bacterium]
MVKKISDDNQKKVLLTAAGLRKLQDELEHLRTTGRREVSLRLKEAISYGDLSENAEYDEAKNQQAFLEQRIMAVDEQVKNAEVIEENADGTIQIGSKVMLERVGSDEKHEYTIVGSTEADPISHKISNESPVGAAILGKAKGDEVVVSAPGGDFSYKISKVV